MSGKIQRRVPKSKFARRRLNRRGKSDKAIAERKHQERILEARRRKRRRADHTVDGTYESPHKGDVNHD